MRLVLSAVVLMAACVALPASAQDTTSPSQPPQPNPEIVTGGDSIRIAVGAATVPTYEGSRDNRVIPGAVIRGSISGFAFTTRGSQLYVDLVPNPPGQTFDVQFGPVVALNFDRTSLTHIDDARIRALGKRKTAIEAGAYVGIAKTGVFTSPYDTLSASVAYRQDVNHAHKSYIVTPQVDYGTPLSRKMFVGVSANANYVGGEYADTYFSIDAADSLASTLPVYSARAGWKNVSVSALANYALTGNLLKGLSVIGGVSYSRLIGNFADSPVVGIAGKRNQWFAAGGLAYSF